MGRARRAAVTGTALSVVAALALLGGCALLPTQPMYQWNGYQRLLYDDLNGNGRSPNQQILLMEEWAEQARRRSAALPPGFRAHLGMMYLRVGRSVEAQRLWQEEKARFPEAAPFMDFLLARLNAAPA